MIDIVSWEATVENSGKGIRMDNRINIMFFLTPKEEVAYIYEDNTVEETLELMEGRRYAAIPILKRSGEYLGTITEGDLLWEVMKKFQMNFKNAMHLPITSLSRRSDNQAVTISTDIEELFSMSMNQNFVPVIDDRGIFIGMVTRRNIIRYFRSRFDQGLSGPISDLLKQGQEQDDALNWTQDSSRRT